MTTKSDAVNAALKKAGKRETRAELEKLLEELRSESKEHFDLAVKRQALVDELQKKLDSSRADFADLKQRLHAADIDNQFMRGYLARVQEDDAVREDLVTIGEPDGEQRMVPKRKHTTFTRPSDFTEPQRTHDLYDSVRHKMKPRHWITY